MATYTGIKIDINGDKYSSSQSYNSTENYNTNTGVALRELMSALKMGVYIPVTFPPDPFIYSFTFYGNVIKLVATDIIDLSTLKIGFLMPAEGFGTFIVGNGRKVEMADLPDMSNLKMGFLMFPEGYYFQNMGVRIYFKNFSLGYGGVDLF